MVFDVKTVFNCLSLKVAAEKRTKNIVHNNIKREVA